ncbi:hypothetical protein EBR25_00875 [bacterium]|nr:hypothetical protein [bacterium]
MAKVSSEVQLFKEKKVVRRHHATLLEAKVALSDRGNRCKLERTHRGINNHTSAEVCQQLVPSVPL